MSPGISRPLGRRGCQECKNRDLPIVNHAKHTSNNFFDAEGSTPLDPDDLKGLLPKHVTAQGQLNEWEQANILEAEKWAFTRKHKDLVSIPFIQKLHKKMFSLTWKWAGQFRMKQTNRPGVTEIKQILHM